MSFHQDEFHQTDIEDDLYTLAEDLLRQIKRKKWNDVYSNIEDLCELIKREDFP